MTLLEYITDLQSKGLSGEEIFAKAQEFKGRTKPEEVVEEVKIEPVATSLDASVTGEPEKIASEIKNTGFTLENGSLDLQPQGLSNKKGGFGAEGFFDNVIRKIDYNENYEKLKKEHQQEQINKVLNKYEPNTPERAYAYLKLQLKPDDTIDIKTFNEIKLKENETKEEKPKELSIDPNEFKWYDPDGLSNDQKLYFQKIGESLEAKDLMIKQIEDYKKDFLGIEKFDKEASLKEGMRDEEFFLGEEMRKSFLLGVEGVKSSFLALPEIVNDFKFATVMKAFDLAGYDTSAITEMNPEVIESFKKISPSVAWTAISSEAQENYEKSLVLQQKMQDDLYKFELETIADEFSERNWANIFDRTVINLAQTMPALFQSMTPVVGLPSLFATTAATANAEVKRNEDYSDLSDFNRLLYAGTAGTAEALLEKYTVKLGNSTFKSLFGKPKNQIITSLRRGLFKTTKEASGEGVSEVGTLTLDKLGQYIFLGDKQAFDNSWKEYFDTFWGGLSMGVSLSGTGNAANFVRQTSQALGIKNTLNDTKYDNIFQAFDQSSISKEIVELAENPNAQKFLNNSVDVKVEEGEISIEEGDNIKNNFIQTQQAANQVKPLGLSEDSKSKVIELLKEKNELTKDIKQVNDSSATEEQSNRINEINKELSGIIKEDKAKVIVKDIETLSETFEGFKNITSKTDLKGSSEIQSFLQTKIQEGNLRKDFNVEEALLQPAFVIQDPNTGQQEIILNPDVASSSINMSDDFHEAGHAIMFETIRKNPEVAKAIAENLEVEINKIDTNLLKEGEFKERLDQYKQDVADGKLDPAGLADETIQIFSQAVYDGTIKPNSSLVTKLMDFVRQVLQDFGIKDIKFNKSQDVINFVKDYSQRFKDIKAGKVKGLGKAITKAATKGIKGKIITEGKTADATNVIEDVIVKFTQTDKGKQASNKVQEIYDTSGKDGAFEIIEQFAPIVSRIVEKRSDAPNFDRQLLTDEINTGKRGIIDLIAEYKPDSNVPLAAYINKYLPARAIEASQRVLGKEFTTDVTEAKAVVAEETKQPEVVSKKVKKPSETTVFDKATEIKIDQAINKNFKGDDVKFSETRNVPKDVANIYAEKLGINPQTITDKTRNYSKQDAGGLTKAKQLLLKNAKDDYARLPELKDDFGKGTFVPKNVKDALYTDGKLTGTLKDYMDLIREKPVKPIYRDRVGQTIRGLLNLAIRNRIIETAQPSPGKRKQQGVKFSKTITLKQNAELLEVAQLGGIDNLANYLKDKGLLKGDITATKSNRKARQASVLESVINGKIPFKLIKLLNLQNFGAARQANSNGDYLYFLNNGESMLGVYRNKKDKNGKKLFDPPTQKDIEAKYGEGVTLQAARGALYSGVNDPAYKTMIKAAKANNKFYPSSSFEGVKRITIPRNTKLTRKQKKANKAQEDINQKALADFVKILDQGIKNKTILLNDAALLVSQAYQGTTSLIKISAPFVGVSDVFVKAPKGTKQAKRNIDYIEEHSPPASKVGLSIIYGLATGTVVPIMKGVKDNFVQIQLSNSSDVLLDIARLDKRFADGTSIITPNAGFLRLAAAGINLNTIEDLNTGSDIATTMGYPLKGKFKKDPSAVNIQNKLMLEQATNPDMKFSKSVGRLDAYVKSLGEGVIQASNKNSGTFGDKVNTDMSMESQVKTLGNYDKTLKFSRALNTPKKGISVFDFDDTLAKTKEKVIVNKADGTTTEISAAKFAEQASELQEAGATFDFTNFENVGKGTQKGPLADLALRRQGKFGSKDIFVLTARPQIAASDIKTFLDGIGLNLPIENITGLEDGSPQAKATWVISKTAEGYNDFYFADDAIKNVKAVAEILDQVDVKSKVQIAKFSKTKTFGNIINDILEGSTGIKSEAEFSKARAQTVGSGKGKFTFFTTPSAEDFVGLIYKFLGKGKVGDAQFQFFQDNLIDPYNRAEQAVTRAKISAANDFKALKNSLKTLPKSLSKKTGIGGFTFGQAARVAVWTRQGMEVPGLSKRDAKELNAFIDNNSELDVFVDELINIQKGKPYPKPSQTWLAGNITSDIVNEINKVNRKEYMQEFNENVDIIFSDKVMNKLEAAYGPKYVEALRDILRRMKSGSNRPVGNSRIVDGLLNWLNNSVGAIMFLNTRSAVLQTISAVNFINFGNNNLIAAGKAFANQKQYWKDFMTLFNSPYLVERRDGLKINVSESEIADAVSESSNKPKAFLNLLLNKGFVLTRFADSFAIAAGGSTFYRNQVKAYVKSGMDQAAAEKQAFDDFYAIAETSQQSSNPSKISQQQASGAGRVILAFANTPMQYARIIKRSSQDLINGRGDWKTNISKIVYYGAMQNLIFNAMQTALFALAFDEEDEEKEDKTGRIANGMADSLLRGLGIQGAAVTATKDALITIYEQANKEKGTPEFRKAINDLFGFSPPLDSKIRKITSGANTFSWEREKMNQEGFNLNNPAYLAAAQVISGLTNVPLDRAIQKINNLRAVTSDSSDKWQKVALLMGWSTWDLGLPYYGVEDKVEMTPQMILKEKVTVMKKETNTKQQKEMLLKLGLTKQQIKDLKYEEARVKKIIELQEKTNNK